MGGARGSGGCFRPAERPDPGVCAVDELVRRIKSFVQHGDNDAIPAGYTYLGQFVDHDITFDPLSKLGQPNDLRELVNFRTPRLDLDSRVRLGPRRPAVSVRVEEAL